MCGACSLSALSNTPDIETVEVTARFWKEALNSVPVSLAVYEVDERLADLSRLDQQISNVKIEQSSVQTRVAIRGSLGYDTSLQQPVGIYVDDVALPLGGTQLPALFHVEQIEIMKGPSGDLYGRHSEAGVVAIQSKTSTWDLYTATSLSYGIMDGANGEEPSIMLTAAVSNELISDMLAGHAAVRVENTTGPNLNIFDNDEDGGEQETRDIAIGLDGKINPSIDVRWRSRISRKDLGKSRLRYLTGALATERFTTNYNTDAFERRDSDIHSLRIDYSCKDYQFTSVTGLTDYHNAFENDLDLSPAPIPSTLLELDDQMMSQGFRISNTDSNETRWLAGMYFFDQDTDIDFAIGGSMMLPRAQRITAIEQTGYAGFGQLAFDIYDRLSITAGLRAERIEKEGNQQFNSLQSNSYVAQLNNTIWLPKLSATYAISNQQNLYTTYAKGYLPAGFNYASAQGLSSFTFDRETSDSIEIGYKASLLDQKLNVQAAIFRTETSDKQIVDLAPGFVQVVSNAAETSAHGIELSVRYKWLPQWRGYLNLGTLDASADEFLVNSFNGTGFITQDLQGNDLPLAPDVTYSFGFEYGHSTGLFASAVVAGSSKYYFDAQNTLEQPRYTTVDASIGYQFEHIRLTLEGNNIFDETIFSRSVRTPVGIVVEDTLARYAGISLSAEW
ncbi:MAG: TonB-dependent receptor [Pseudomonadota bacterium]